MTQNKRSWGNVLMFCPILKETCRKDCRFYFRFVDRELEEFEHEITYFHSCKILSIHHNLEDIKYWLEKSETS